MPGISAYSASKGAHERWAESLAYEIAPFGLGVRVLVAGLLRTDVLEQTKSYADSIGPYAAHCTAIDQMQPRVVRRARPPERFASALARSLADTAPFVRRSTGGDAQMLLAASGCYPFEPSNRLSELLQACPGRSPWGRTHDRPE